MSTTSVTPLVSEPANESFDDLFVSPKQEHNGAGFRDQSAGGAPAHHPKWKAAAAALPEGLAPDLGMAGQFIKALTGSPDTPVTWQTFSDNDITKIIEADGTKVDPLAKIRHGTLADLAPELAKLNQQGAGIFITINETDLKGRTLANILKVRAFIADFDTEDAIAKADTANAKLPFSMIVESSHGKRHGYWLADAENPGILPSDYRRLSDVLIPAIGADTGAKDVARVLRAPGFFHCKGEPRMVRMLSVTDARYTAEQVVHAFGLNLIAAKPEKAAGTMADITLTCEQITHLREAMSHLSPDDYADWADVAANLHSSGEAGYQLWLEWSKSTSRDNFDEGECERKWAKDFIGGTKSNYKSIFAKAAEKGWVNPGSQRATAEADFATMMGTGSAPSNPQNSFRFIPLRELADSTVNPHWVVKHWLERDTVTCIAGQPKHGKSFSAFDIGLHVAAGIPWCGKRVEQGPVFVIAGEGQGGTSRRTKGWLLKHPEVSSDIPFYVSNRAITLDEDGARRIKAIIEEMCEAHGVSPSMIIVDTLARSFPGDENKTEDMNTFVAALDQHLKVMDVALIIVHHSTKSGSDVLRGNSALRGALDGLIEVAKADTPSPTGGILIEVKPHWLKDGQTPTSLFFDCEVVKTGIDEDLEDITTLVPMLTSQPGAAAASLTNIERQALDILRGLQCEDGNIGVKLNEWRKACVEAGLIGGRSPNAIERAMERLCDRLSEADSIFKPSNGKYRAVIHTSFDNEASA